MRMITRSIFCLLASALLVAPLLQAQPSIDALNITAIKSMQVEKTGGQVLAHAVVRFRNDSPMVLLMKEGDLDVHFKAVVPDSSVPPTTLQFGKTRPPLLEFPAGKDVDYSIDIVVGGDSAGTFDRIIGLSNMIGNPQNQIRMTFTGAMKLGQRGKNRTVFQAIEGDVTFTAKVQREVLME